MDRRLLLQLYCYNDKTSTAGVNRDSIRRRNEAEVDVSVPGAADDDEDNSNDDQSSTPNSGRGRGNRAGRGPAAGGTPTSAETTRRLVAAVQAAMNPLDPPDARRDLEYRRKNDLNPETRKTFDLRAFITPAKDHKRIVSLN